MPIIQGSMGRWREEAKSGGKGGVKYQRMDKQIINEDPQALACSHDNLS